MTALRDHLTPAATQMHSWPAGSSRRSPFGSTTDIKQQLDQDHSNQSRDDEGDTDAQGNKHCRWYVLCGLSSIVNGNECTPIPRSAHK